MYDYEPLSQIHQTSQTRMSSTTRASELTIRRKIQTAVRTSVTKLTTSCPSFADQATIQVTVPKDRIVVASYMYSTRFSLGHSQAYSDVHVFDTCHSRRGLASFQPTRGPVRCTGSRFLPRGVVSGYLCECNVSGAGRRDRMGPC